MLSRDLWKRAALRQDEATWAARSFGMTWGGNRWQTAASHVVRHGDPMRVVIAMMKHETKTFSPVPTPIGRFARGTPLLPGGTRCL